MCLVPCQVLAESDVLVVASSNNTPPINTLSEDGRLQGFGRDLSDAVFSSLNQPIQRLHTSYWPEAIGWLLSAQADVIHDVAFSEERTPIMAFSEPILEMDEVIFVRSETATIHNLQSLYGKKVACVDKQISHMYLLQFPMIECHVVRTPMAGLHALLSGEVDAYVYPQPIIEHLSQQLGMASEIKIVGQPVRRLRWAMVTATGNQALLDKINQGLAQVRESGRYDEIYNYWFGKGITSYQNRSQQQLLTWGLPLLAISLLALLVLVYKYFRREGEIGRLQQQLARLEQQNELLSAFGQRLEKVVEAAPVCIFQLHLNKEGFYHLPFIAGCAIDFDHLDMEKLVNDSAYMMDKLFSLDGDKLDASLRQSADDLTPVKGDFRVAVDDERFLWLELNALPQRQEDGSTLWYGVMRDMADEKKSEHGRQEVLRDLERLVKERTRLAEQQARIIDQLQDAVFIVDLNGQVRSWNIGASHLFGFESQEILGQSIALLLGEDLFQRLQEDFIAPVMAKGRHELELELQTRDMRAFRADVSMSAFSSEEERITGIIFYIRDVTARRLAEDALRKSERSLELALYGADLGSWEWNLVTNEFNFNKRWAQILGYQADQLGNNHETWRRLLHPEDREAVEQRLQQHLHGKSDIYESEHRMKASNGQWKWLLERGRVLEMGESGEPSLAAGTSLDISERKQIDALLERKRAELAAANQELEAFSYSVSHDLRAPLRVIDGFSQLLLSDYGEQLDEDAKLLLTRIRAGVQRMAQLIDDLLTLSKVSRVDMHYQTVNLSTLAQEIVMQLREASPQREVETVIAPSMIVIGEPRLLRIMLENVLGNAWKFTSRRDRARIVFGCRYLHKSQIFYVRDNGAGIDMAYVNKLFKPFQRLHTEEQFPGTGIGLATVRRVMNRHGGEVWLKGRPDKGVTVYFTLSPHVMTEEGDYISLPGEEEKV